MAEAATAENSSFGTPSGGTLEQPRPRMDRSVVTAWTILVIAILGACWPLILAMPDVWFGFETYYAHGMVVPFCSAFMIWDQWPKLRQIPVQGSNWALIPIAVLLLLGWPTLRSDMHSIMSVMLILLLLCSVWYVAGARWMKAVTIPAAYLAFGLPVFGVVIDRFTQPLQLKSADLAYHILDFLRLQPYKLESDKILIGNYTLFVAVPCSGLRTLLAVAAIVCFFVVVAHLRWWANLILVVMALPLSLLVNSVRIAAIGIVGNAYGNAAAAAFHDYSGYMALVICFGVLFWTTKALGWKS